MLPKNSQPKQSKGNSTVNKLYRQVRVRIYRAPYGAEACGEFTKYLADSSPAVFRGQMTRLLNETRRKHPDAKRIDIDAIDSLPPPPIPYVCNLCGQRIDDGKACGCGARY
jgi:hypothetical protein